MNNLFITFLASFLIWLMFTGLFALWIIDGKVKKEVVIHAVTAAVFAWIFAHIIKTLIPVERPFHLNGNTPMTLTTPSDSAFPSGHTALAFALSVTVWLHNKKLGILFLICSLLVGISRVIANVHYPLDILGGAILGSLVSLAVEELHLYNLLIRIRKRP